MDDAHLITGLRHVSLDPVRGRLVARAHLAGCDGVLAAVTPVLDRVGDFARLPAPDPGDEAGFAAMRSAEGTGRPLGNAEFIAGLERIPGRRIARRAPRPKPKGNGQPQERLPMEES
jgi:putative transposase